MDGWNLRARAIDSHRRTLRTLFACGSGQGQGGRRAMKLAFPLPHLIELMAMTQPWELAVTGAGQTRAVKRAEELGYEMVASSEHFVIPKDHVELSGAHYFHAFSAMGYIAGATERMRVNSCISLLPLQNPIVQAKALSTLDFMSGGRVTVTFGVGWLEGEFQQLGVPFHERGAMSDEYVAAMVELWTKDDPVFEGKYVSFRDVAFAPKPVQKPHLPIWFGGDSDGALKRTARFGSGWWPFLTKPEDIPSRLDFIKSQPTFKGGPFEVFYGMATALVGEGHVAGGDPNAKGGQPAQAIIDRLSWFQEIGVTMSQVPVPAVRDLDEFLDYAQWVMEEIAPKVG
jgi:probable F420-dependent oxidoreductase